MSSNVITNNRTGNDSNAFLLLDAIICNHVGSHVVSEVCCLFEEGRSSCKNAVTFINYCKPSPITNYITAFNQIPPISSCKRNIT